MHSHQIDANVSIYRISRCGFFTRKKISPQSFANVTDIFADMTSWVKKSDNVFNTSTFECAEDSDEHPVYCYDISKSASTGNVGLVLWNKTNINGGAITAIRASEPYGSAPIELAEQDDDLIPGIPTYYWISPKLKCCATIRFGGTFSGVSGFSNYVLSYMRNHSRWRLQDGEDVTYWEGALGKMPANYFPKFSIKRKRDPVEVRRFYTQQSNIRKVICKDILKQSDVSEEALWQSVLSFLKIATPRTLPYDVPIRTELNYCPTMAEMKAIISHDDKPLSHGHDIGFRFTNDPKIYWLSGIYDRRKFPVTVESVDDSGNVFSAASLVKALDDTMYRGLV